MYGCEVKQLLVRTNNTVQVGANAERRMEQALTAYKAREMSNTEKYVLLDDV